MTIHPLKPSFQLQDEARMPKPRFIVEDGEEGIFLPGKVLNPDPRSPSSRNDARLELRVPSELVELMQQACMKHLKTFPHVSHLARALLHIGLKCMAEWERAHGDSDFDAWDAATDIEAIVLQIENENARVPNVIKAMDVAYDSGNESLHQRAIDTARTFASACIVTSNREAVMRAVEKEEAKRDSR